MKKLAALLSLFTLLIAPPAFAATLSLSPNSGTINAGCSFSADVMLDTAGAQTDGTDVILNYDPTRLNVASITNETLYSTYPLSAADPQNNRINISGLASVSQAVTTNGPQKFATINFQVPSTVTPGPANVTFYFIGVGDTTDSNVVERSTIQDLLVPPLGDGHYTIGTGSCSAQTLKTVSNGIGGATSSAEVSTSSAIPLKQLPNSGSTQTTAVVTLVGVVLTLLGAVGLALL